MKRKNNALLIISLALNVLFILAISVFIINKGGITYIVGKVTEQRKEEFSIHHQVQTSLFDVYQSKPSDVVFVGDSLTDFANWNELLEIDNVKSRGIPGDQTKDLLDTIDIVLDDKPAKIFLMVGINDLSNGVSPSKALDNYKKIVEKIKNRSPNTELIIQSLLPINTEVLQQTETNNKMIVDFNDNLKKLAVDKNLEYVDLHPHFLKDEQLDSSLTTDGLHINGDGYLIWDEIIKPYVNAQSQ
jgi:lysophospholipase L1-like esterase